ncbi:MAG: phosphonoacetate hydrolase [Hyphomicrobiaceae bacterium]|nr:phosphonoacetate hydrolase [Hyphomicrobiaceae bacterium]
MTHPNSVTVNDRSYNWPTQTLVVICCDGSEPDYMELARAKGLMPNLNAIIEKGENLRGHSVVPSFTNPNNLSIVTGRPPAVHGISGNFFLEPESGEEVMMNDPKFLRAPTIFEGFQKAGARVAVVTAKDKLRRLLGNNLAFDGTAISFSSEKADQATLAEHGIENVCELVGMDVPDVYSAELSEFVFAAGVKLLQTFKPDLMYLSTTDYVQHKFAPDTDGANAFYVMMDKYLGELDAAGAIIVLTADHGMKAKTRADGTPDVIYLQDQLDEWVGDGKSKVILPITDPYVIHHGALGSFATVYLEDSVDAQAVADQIAALSGIHVVYDSERGCREFELPRDRMGDLIVVSRDTKVLGTRETEHDLSALKEPLRSHGGITEQEIPIVVNRHTANLNQPLRNFDAFSIGLNHIAQAAQAAE